MSDTSSSPTVYDISFEQRKLTFETDDQIKVDAYFKEYRGTGVPSPNLGAPGDTYIDAGALTLYARHDAKWVAWPGPYRTKTLVHPIYDDLYLWCSLSKKTISWFKKADMKRISESAKRVISQMLSPEPPPKTTKNGDLKRKAGSLSSDDDIHSKKPKPVKSRAQDEPVTTPTSAPTLGALAWVRCKTIAQSSPRSPHPEAISRLPSNPQDTAPPALFPIPNLADLCARMLAPPRHRADTRNATPVVANFLFAHRGPEQHTFGNIPITVPLADVSPNPLDLLADGALPSPITPPPGTSSVTLPSNGPVVATAPPPTSASVSVAGTRLPNDISSPLEAENVALKRAAQRSLQDISALTAERDALARKVNEVSAAVEQSNRDAVPTGRDSVIAVIAAYAQLQQMNVSLEARNAELLRENNVLRAERTAVQLAAVRLETQNGALKNRNSELMRLREAEVAQCNRLIAQAEEREGVLLREKKQLEYDAQRLTELSTALEAAYRKGLGECEALQNANAVLRTEITSPWARDKEIRRTIGRLGESVGLMNTEDELLRQGEKTSGEHAEKREDEDPGPSLEGPIPRTEMEDAEFSEGSAGNEGAESVAVKEELHDELASDIPRSSEQIIDLTLDSDNEGEESGDDEFNPVEVPVAKAPVKAHSFSSSPALKQALQKQTSHNSRNDSEIFATAQRQDSLLSPITADRPASLPQADTPQLLTDTRAYRETSSTNNDSCRSGIDKPPPLDTGATETVFNARNAEETDGKAEDELSPVTEKDSEKVEQMLRIKTEEVEGATWDGTTATTDQLTKAHIDILWMLSEDGSSVVCNECSCEGNEYEVPSSTTRQDLAAHSRGLHLAQYEAILSATSGMNNEQVQMWWDGLDQVE
ncbi:hypothetical protein B0H15DRAFT_465441 [Mycena belliarum]|uniref:Uncharacterized protein n=1 Tax=Mycena belliarum TaxID=1033014 RepID=A0AAD6XUS5_9AGAR|nr:hypothetical protein B0H15DRAFT_465441 [Mycena belliae]